MYGDSVHSIRTCISIIHDGTIDLCASTTSTPLMDTLEIGYESHTKVSYNSTLDYTTISLPVDVLADANEPTSHASHHSLIIVQSPLPILDTTMRVVFHPLYPVS